MTKLGKQRTAQIDVCRAPRTASGRSERRGEDEVKGGGKVKKAGGTRVGELIREIMITT